MSSALTVNLSTQPVARFGVRCPTRTSPPGLILRVDWRMMLPVGVPQLSSVVTRPFVLPARTTDITRLFASTCSARQRVSTSDGSAAAEAGPNPSMTIENTTMTFISLSIRPECSSIAVSSTARNGGATYADVYSFRYRSRREDIGVIGGVLGGRCLAVGGLLVMP